MNKHVVVDVGNSRMKWGRCDSRRVVEMVSLPSDQATWDKRFNSWKPPTGLWVISGSHPRRMEEFMSWLAHHGQQARSIKSYEELNLELKVDHPDQVGLDRLLNAVAVSDRSKGSPAVIIDAGSAVTVDYIDESGVFCGGAIFPGLRLMAQALHDHTAKLPVVEITEVKDPPGTNTITAIETGVFHAVLGGMDRLIQAYEKQSSVPPHIFLGGGDANLFATRLARTVTLWPEMTLEGIRRTVEGPP